VRTRLAASLSFHYRGSPRAAREFHLRALLLRALVLCVQLHGEPSQPKPDTAAHRRSEASPLLGSGVWLRFRQRRRRAAQRRHPTGRERVSSPTLQTLQNQSWVSLSRGGFPNPG
jgi:hypothetical protein